jgi:galactose mutarotase-like enzyme
MRQENRSWLVIASDELRAEIDPLGAQLSILRDREGRDLQWGGDPAVWAGRAPVLFPIVGELAGGRYRLGASSFVLPRHGFARRRLFSLREASAGSVSLRLSDDAETLAVYPFRFDLDLSFTLTGPTLTISTTVCNRGAVDLPASFGFHPAFRWPLPYGEERGAHFLEFAVAEPAPVRRLDAQGLLTPEPQPTPVVGRRLTLQDALFTRDALIFDQLQSNSLTYGAGQGPRLRVDFSDTPLLGVWTKPAAGFICIEPWHGIADPAGYSGDFRTKPAIFTVAPGATKTIAMAVTLLPDASD